MAKQHVTVALSGDGGDELFGGYNRYFWGKKIWNKLSWMPWSLRRLLSAFILSQPVERWDVLSNYACKLFRSTGVAQLGDKAHKLGARLETVRNIDDLYMSLISQWGKPQPVVNCNYTARTILDYHEAWPNIDSDEERMMYLDSMTYLPDDILCKVDRAAMGVSLETRVPFLDHRVVEYAWQLPLSLKIKNGQGKWLLRQLLYKHVPKALIERPKQGFSIPLAEWLRGPLRDWAEALLDEQRLIHEGYFDPAPILHKWNEHLAGRGNWQHHLWSVLMFQAWLEKQNGTQ
jgi:asparagine synthase (glutamine-hydrolysing)